MVKTGRGQACCSVGRSECYVEAFTPEIGDNTSNFLLEIWKRPYNFNSIDFHAVFDDQTHSFCAREGCVGLRSHRAKHVSGGVKEIRSKDEN